MNDATIGFLILGLGIVLVLALVFAVTLRSGRGGPARTAPPPGVHLPSSSVLPVVMALPLLGAISGVTHPIIGPLGLLVLLAGIWAWVRAAGHEWHETERGSHDSDAH